MQVIGEHIFLVLIITCMVAVIWLPTLWISLSIYTPETLLKKYFKQPYFTLPETVLMKEFPGFLIRTGIFGWLLVFPSLDKKRNIKNIKNHMPRWYRFFLKVFIYSSIIIAFVLLASFASLSIIDAK